MLTRRSVLSGGLAMLVAPPVFATAAAAKLPRIVVLGTGGTIASTAARATQVTGYRVTEGVETLLAAVPALAEIASLRSEQVVNVGSANITDAHLLMMATQLNALLASDEVDGAVVTHGTDTLEETAYFLNLTVHSDKPVVMTGAMRPASALGADGPMNLYNAVLLAGSPQARGKGVLVMLNDRIAAARFVTKTNTTGLDTFRSSEQGFVGAVTAGRADFYNSPLRRHTRASEFDVSQKTLLPRVDIVFEHQSSTGEFYADALAHGARGIVVAAVGSGGMSTVAQAAADNVAKAGVIVVRASRTGSGTIPKRARDVGTNFVSADSLNPQKARILLMLALTKTRDPVQIQRYFETY